MLISIVNYSSKDDAEVQRVIRAINRQIREDFEPHWHMGGHLRLEGREGATPDSATAVEMRGQAVIYIYDGASPEDALGYHERNNRGIPYGFVFLKLCEQLGEEWSVTLSHEALELVADPEANRLVVGPHPRDPSREVFFWYEVCDAVQTESYEIDGVRVSNFVLRLYFTLSDETGGRNDFLGTKGRTPALSSFGVKQGGYVGFYDPLLREHDMEVAGPEAEFRRELKAQAGRSRRANRYRGHGGSDRASEGVRFEGFAVLATPQDDPEAGVRRVVDQILDASWSIRRLVRGTNYFAVQHSTQAPAPAAAWDRARLLAHEPEIEAAEPMFELAFPELTTEHRATALRASGGGADHLPGSADCEWSIKMIDAPEAWGMFAGKGRQPGEGIIIGHPDTGYTRHPEIWPTRVTLQGAYDFFRDDFDPADDLEGGGISPTPGHGTATSSVIVSEAGQPTEQFVTGVAPRATVVPLRVMKSPVLWSTDKLIRAIDHAVTTGCHVISMSLGTGAWWAIDPLHAAIKRAVEADIIVIAAAGNYVGPVVWPGRFPEVLCVAACNVQKKPWFHSSAGPTVDVTAPGESVWRARTTSKNGKQSYDVARGNGTSYATATVAGIAALWLSYHGRDRLIAKCGRGHVAEVFRAIARASCMPMVLQDWEQGDFGAGIINAHRVLQARVEDHVPAVHGRRATAASPAGSTLSMRSFLDELDYTPAVLASRAGTTEVQARAALQLHAKELAFQVATDGGLRGMRNGVRGARAIVTPQPTWAGGAASTGLLEALRSPLASSTQERTGRRIRAKQGRRAVKRVVR